MKLVGRAHRLRGPARPRLRATPTSWCAAVTHASMSAPTRPDNQRLEFLGDRVLGLVMAEALLAADTAAQRRPARPPLQRAGPQGNLRRRRARHRPRRGAAARPVRDDVGRPPQGGAARRRARGGDRGGLPRRRLRRGREGRRPAPLGRPDRLGPGPTPATPRPRCRNGPRPAARRRPPMWSSAAKAPITRPSSPSRPASPTARPHGRRRRPNGRPNRPRPSRSSRGSPAERSAPASIELQISRGSRAIRATGAEPPATSGHARRDGVPKDLHPETRPMTTRAGFVALIGEPNAGKSTLLNRMVGAKVSIVTHKVQTTRARIRGVGDGRRRADRLRRHAGPLPPAPPARPRDGRRRLGRRGRRRRRRPDGRGASRRDARRRGHSRHAQGPHRRPPRGARDQQDRPGRGACPSRSRAGPQRPLSLRAHLHDLGRKGLRRGRPAAVAGGDAARRSLALPRRPDRRPARCA